MGPRIGIHHIFPQSPLSLQPFQKPGEVRFSQTSVAVGPLPQSDTVEVGPSNLARGEGLLGHATRGFSLQNLPDLNELLSQEHQDVIQAQQARQLALLTNHRDSA